jgi:hypothetical protein
MPTRKHPGPGRSVLKLPADDLKTNPGIKASRGTSGAAPEDLEELLEGENTFEGDVANQTDASGAIRPDDWGRTNR